MEKKAIIVRQINTNTVHKEVKNEDKISLLTKPNPNILRYKTESNRTIHFEKESSIAQSLGFDRKELSANKASHFRFANK